MPMPSENVFIESGVEEDSLAPLFDPDFISATAADPYLDDRGWGLDVAAGREHRFYPFQILVWHEIVNDTLATQLILVTYSPLCQSGLVYERRINKETATFGTSSQVLNSNLLMYDKTSHSLWSQLKGVAVKGDRQGQNLTLLPSTMMRWQDWKAAYPTGRVLSKETGFARDYTLNSYSKYLQNQDVLFPILRQDDRLPTKDYVYGVVLDGKIYAVSEKTLRDKTVVSFEAGDVPLVMFWDQETEVTRLFKRTARNKVFSFTFDEKWIKDMDTGSTWNTLGQAFSGANKGITLEPVALRSAFWFCLAGLFPDLIIIQ